MEKYIDLHMHSTCSDGTCSIEELIEQAKALKLKAISITDHDNLNGYKRLNNLNSDIEIVKGVEIASTINKVPVEILCYGYDFEKMEKFMKDNCISHEEDSEIKVRRLKKIFNNLGINLNFDCDNFDYRDLSKWAISEIYEEIYQNQDALNLLKEENPEYLDGCKKFFRMGINNKNSKFFVDMSDVYMRIDILTNFAKENKFVTFLAHPYEYYENMVDVLNDAKSFVDGIEVYHPTANKESREFLEKFCRDNNLLISGGSDYHGRRGKLNSEQVPYSVLANIKKRLIQLKNENKY